MKLGAIATYFDDLDIDVLRDSDGVWQKKKLKGQIKISDDFISIFNRPTRRRMLFLSPKMHQKLNGSVIRIPSAEEVYLVGNPQKDLGKEGTYRVTLPLNKALDEVEVYEVKTVGPSSNPGSLQRLFKGRYYMDLELRTISQADETIGSVFSKYFFWFPKNIDFNIGDEFIFDNKTYRVLESFFDTGFRGLRTTTEDDSRESLVYRQLTLQPIFDNITGVYSSAYTDIPFSGEVKEQTTRRRDAGQLYADKIFTVLIEGEHISFEPTIKDLITIDGNDRDISTITRHRHNKSWEIQCQ